MTWAAMTKLQIICSYALWLGCPILFLFFILEFILWP